MTAHHKLLSIVLFLLSQILGSAQDDQTAASKNLNGISMYYELSGKGDPLVIIHGNSDSLRGVDGLTG